MSSYKWTEMTYLMGDSRNSAIPGHYKIFRAYIHCVSQNRTKIQNNVCMEFH